MDAQAEQEGFQEKHGADATPIDPSTLSQGAGDMPIAVAGRELPSEQVREWTLAEARDKYGREGEAKWCVNCKNMDFSLVHGIQYGACLLRPRKEARVEMDFTCEEFEKAKL